MQTRF
jgi:hypothetical protein